MRRSRDGRDFEPSVNHQHRSKRAEGLRSEADFGPSPNNQTTLPKARFVREANWSDRCEIVSRATDSARRSDTPHRISGPPEGGHYYRESRYARIETALMFDHDGELVVLKFPLQQRLDVPQLNDIALRRGNMKDSIGRSARLPAQTRAY